MNQYLTKIYAYFAKQEGASYKKIRNTSDGEYVHFSKTEISLIDTPAFQRLHDLKQMGTTYLFFPNANGTRFAHLIGCFDIAKRVAHHLAKDLLDLGYSSDEIIYFEQLLKLSALLHDIGHGPFSHALDSFLEEHDTSHEEYSKKIILETKVGELIEKGRKDGEFIVSAQEVAELIFPDKNKPLKGLSLLAKNLVSGPIDVDRMDYLNRDTQLTGVKYGMIDLPRTISILKAVRANGEIQLAIKESGLPNLIDFFNARISMFKQIHSHKLKRIYDYHVSQIIRDYFGDRFNKDDLNQFLSVTDNEILVHARQTQNKNRHAQALMQRKHFKNILYKLDAYPSESKVKDIFERLIAKIQALGIKNDFIYDEYQKDSAIDIPLYLVDKNYHLTLITSQRFPELKNIGFHYFRLYLDNQTKAFGEILKTAAFYQKILDDLN